VWVGSFCVVHSITISGSILICDGWVLLISVLQLANMKSHCWFNDGSIGQGTVKPEDNEAPLTLSRMCLLPLGMHLVWCHFLQGWDISSTCYSANLFLLCVVQSNIVVVLLSPIIYVHYCASLSLYKVSVSIVTLYCSLLTSSKIQRPLLLL